MSRPLSFTVVIPAYNAETFLAATLDAVRVQTCPDFDVVVVNDGSRDRTGAVVREYAAAHPGFSLALVEQENKGIGGARNAGVQRAGGDFIAFLDADDSWAPDKLATVALFLADHPGVDVVCHDETEVRGDGSRRPLCYGDVREPAYEDLLFQGNRLSTSATVVRAELARRVGGFSEDPAFNSAEDYEFWLRLARAGGRFAHLSANLGEYRRVEGSVTMKIEYHHRNIWNVIEHHLGLLRATGKYPERFLDKIVRRKRGEHLASLARAYAGAGERGLALRIHLQSLAAAPLSLKAYTKLARTVAGL